MEDFDQLKAQFDAINAKIKERLVAPYREGWKREADDGDRIMAALGVEGDLRTEAGWLRVDKALERIELLKAVSVPPPASQGTLEGLRAALQHIADSDDECQCEHDTEDCCVLQVGSSVFCSKCYAAAALRGDRA